jgi:phosphoribosylformylglycinamidine synthase
MGQFVGCIAGMRAASLALSFPIVSGNVSLYNETDGEAILPTPVIGGVGVLDDVSKHATIALKGADETLVLIGETIGWLGQSVYLREIAGQEAGAPPPVDLDAEKANGDFVRGLIQDGRVTACHDISDGGIAVAVAEMALAAKGLGVALTLSGDAPLHGFLFGEDQARYLLTTSDASAIVDKAGTAGVSARIIGKTTSDDRLTLRTDDSISLDMLRSRHEGWLPGYMQGA